MLKRVKVTVALTAAASSAVLLMGSQQALATTAQGAANSPTADVVGVGSDTLQFAGDFLADGSPAASVGGLATSGYNAAGNKYRMINYDATGDAVGRGVYNSLGSSDPSGGTYYVDGTNPTPTSAVVLRAKQQPVETPDGSSAGINALLNDTPGVTGGYDGAANGSIQYARMSRIIKGSEETTCGNATHLAGCGTLHPVAIGTDTLVIAHADPSVLTTPAVTDAVPLSGFQLALIYGTSNSCTGASPSPIFWDDPRIGGTVHAEIIPVLPQLNSGTRNDFLADLNSHYGLASTTSLSSCIVTAQEHDPSGITKAVAVDSTTGTPTPAQAIEPFSLARIHLINSGYFTNAGVGANQVDEASGTPTGTISGDTHVLYNLTRNMYITVRDVDVNNTTPWQPGSANNWAKTLFVGAGVAYLSRATGQANVTAAGFIGGYIDCGAGDTNQPACPAPSS